MSDEMVKEWCDQINKRLDGLQASLAQHIQETATAKAASDQNFKIVMKALVILGAIAGVKIALPGA